MQSLTEKQQQLGNNNNKNDVMIVTSQIWRNTNTKSGINRGKNGWKVYRYKNENKKIGFKTTKTL